MGVCLNLKKNNFQISIFLRNKYNLFLKINRKKYFFKVNIIQTNILKKLKTLIILLKQIFISIDKFKQID